VTQAAGDRTGTECPVPFVVNEDRGWLDKEPTRDEQDVVSWMERRTLPKTILHVGVGTGLLRRRFGARVRQGITKDGMEATEARSLGMEVILGNKYDVKSYRSSLLAPFDCCVDVNIRSYACCDSHFREYMDLIFESLAPGGTLLTAITGLDYLIPTSVRSLRVMFPNESVRVHGNVVVIKRRLIRRLLQRWYPTPRP
jgi:hypothetical protein